MDAGLKQGRKAAEIKAQIKSNACRRRANEKVRGLARGVTRSNDLSTNGNAFAALQDFGPGSANLTSSSPSSRDDHSQSTATHRFLLEKANESQYVLESVMLMTYLDHLFPIVYPFYRPGILEGARGWLLPVALSHTCLRHVVVALATQIMGSIETQPGSNESICGALNPQLLHEQTEVALKSAQHELNSMQLVGEESDLLDISKVFANSVQLFVVESYIGTGNWRPHMDAAIVLTNQMFRARTMHALGNHQSTSSVPKRSFSQVVEQLSPPLNFVKPHPPLWTPPQASYRFHTALLIFADVIASTVLRRRPKLQPQYGHVLASADEVRPPECPKLDIYQFFGVDHATLLVIADVAELAEWKWEQERLQQSSTVELVHRGIKLETRLLRTIETLKQEAKSSLSAVPSQTGPRALFDLQPAGGPAPTAHIARIISLIWYHAAFSYLLSTYGDSKPEAQHHTKLDENLSTTTHLLNSLCDSKNHSSSTESHTVQAPAWLRSMAWPIAVTGLLLNPDQEQEMHVMQRVMKLLDGSLGVFGTVKNVKRVVEEAWEHRGRGACDKSVAELLGGVLLI